MADAPDPALPQYLFGRRYRLQIFVDRPGAQSDVTIDSLNVQFTIKRSLSNKTPNRADIVVMNLSEDTRRSLHAERNVYIHLEAGYDGLGMSLIFRGDLAEAWSAQEGTEWTTTLSSEDGGKKKRSARVNVAYAAGTSAQRIISDLAGRLDLGVGNALIKAAAAKLGRSNSATVNKGLSASGDVIGQLDRVLASCGLDWSVQDGELQVLDSPYAALPDTPLLLTPTTGLIGSPELGKQQLVKARALIIPGLHPGRRVEVRSRYVTGIYRIDTITYRGEAHGAPWDADLELSLVK